MDLGEEQFNLLEYLRTDSCSQSDDLSLGNEVDAIAEDLLKDVEAEVDDSIIENVPEITSFKCNICSETFDLDCDLQTHMIAHPEDKKPFCTLCQKQFKDLRVLKRHVRTHFKKKPFQVYRKEKYNFLFCK